MATQRGRKSSAQKEIAKIAAENSITTFRHAHPTGLNFEELTFWHVVVQSMPPNWFDAGTEAVLANYVRHCVAANILSRQIDEFTDADRSDPKKFLIYEKLLKLRVNETKQIQFLATSLRLTKHSRQDSKVAYNQAAANTDDTSAPWNG